MTGVDFDWTLQRDESNNEDSYHLAANGQWCGAAADGGLEQPCLGGGSEHLDVNLYFSIHGYFNPGISRSSGFYAFTWLPYTAVEIPGPQLMFLRDLFYTNCYPTQKLTPIFNPGADKLVNRYWNRNDYVNGYYSRGKNSNVDFLYRHAYSTDGHEADPDTVQYCDWMFDQGINVSAPAPIPGTPAGETVVWSDPMLGKNKCDDFPFVACDLQGNIVELLLESKAFSGPIPPSISALTALKKLQLGTNQMNGTLPAGIFASRELEELGLSHNYFTGSLPCMSHLEPKLKKLVLSQNHFTGPLPPCIFTDSPLLTDLDVSYNRLDTAIPPQIMHATELTKFHAPHAGIRGELPLEMMCLHKLFNLDLARNRLKGTLPEVITNGWTAISRLNLDMNQLEGQLPTFDDHTPELRYLYLRDNRFSGAFHAQLAGFQNEQVATSGSDLAIDGNRFTGVLPRLFYDLLTDAHRVKFFTAARNHMLCDPVTGEWPEWIFRFGTSNFGACAKLARPTAVADIVEGEYLRVSGTDFQPSEELKCRLANVTYAASFVNPTLVLCGPIGEDTLAPGAQYEVTVANYGQDFYGPTLAQSTYVPVTAWLPFSPPPPSPPPPPPPGSPPGVLDGDHLPAWTIGVISASSAIAFCLLGAIVLILSKERKGTPFFQPLEVVTARPPLEVAAAVIVTTDLACAMSQLPQA